VDHGPPQPEHDPDGAIDAHAALMRRNNPEFRGRDILEPFVPRQLAFEAAGAPTTGQTQ
jgi:hypothetical protein